MGERRDVLNLFENTPLPIRAAKTKTSVYSRSVGENADKFTGW